MKISLWHYDQARETPGIIALLDNGSCANEMFKYFSGCRLALIIGSSCSWQLLGFVAGGILVEEFKSVWIISELL